MGFMEIEIIRGKLSHITVNKQGKLQNFLKDHKK
jgi:hypothetical protein